MKSKAKYIFVWFVLGCSDGPSEVPVSGIIVTPNSILLTVGQSMLLTIVISPSDATNRKVTWISSNGQVAEVDNTGLVTANGEGEANITVASLDGEKEATCSVKVIAGDQILHRNNNWNLHNPAVYSIKVNDASMLQLDLEQNALWYNNSEGGFIYRSISGNFDFTASVSSVKKSNNAQPVACDVCLGGLMVRNLSSTTADEDYVHLVTGFTPGGLGAETKNTTNSNSQYTPTGPNQLPNTDGYSSHDLRIVRNGNSFALYKKSTADSDWVLLATYDRPDLPATLAVGINIYTTVGGGTVADLSVIYKNLTITQ